MKIKKESTLPFIFHNFFNLLLFSLFPAVLCFIFPNPYSFALFIRNNFNSAFVINNLFSDIYVYFSFFNLTSTWWGGIIMLVFACIAIIFNLVYSERSMRLGIRRLGSLFRGVSNTIFSAIPYFIINIVMVEVVNISASGLCYLLSLGLSGYALALIVIIVMFSARILSFYLISIFLFTMPAAQIEGYTFATAASYSVRIFASHNKTQVIRLSIVFFCVEAVIFITDFFVPVLSTLMGAGGVLALIMFLPSYAMRYYIKYTDAERRDLKPNIFDQRSDN